MDENVTPQEEGKSVVLDEGLLSIIREAATVKPEDIRAALQEVGQKERKLPVFDEEQPRELVRGKYSMGQDRALEGEAVWANTYMLLNGVATQNPADVRKFQTQLALVGEYGSDWQEKAKTEQRAIMLTSSEGAPFLPTTVINTIQDVAKEVGIARRLATTYTIITGDAKVPNVSGRLTAFAVNEAAEIKARKAAFSSVTLDPKKWGVISPWSSEMNIEIGAQFIQKVVQLAAEAFADLEDQSVFTADGTATYHSLTGLLNNGSIGEHLMATGDGAFTDIDYDDLLTMRQQPAVGVRRRGAYVFHHDFEVQFLKLKDGAGQYIFPRESGVNNIAGRPVYYTEAMPDLADTALSTSFGLYGDFSYVTMGLGQSLTATLLTEASIKDVDDSTVIRLGMTDSMALRFIAYWDVKFGLTTPFAKITTSSSYT